MKSHVHLVLCSQQSTLRLESQDMSFLWQAKLMRRSEVVLEMISYEYYFVYFRLNENRAHTYSHSGLFTRLHRAQLGISCCQCWCFANVMRICIKTDLMFIVFAKKILIAFVNFTNQIFIQDFVHPFLLFSQICIYVLALCLFIFITFRPTYVFLSQLVLGQTGLGIGPAGLGLSIGLDSAGLGLGLSFSPTGLSLGHDRSGLVNITGDYQISDRVFINHLHCKHIFQNKAVHVAK